MSGRGTLDGEDLIVWPDDTWCYGYELHEMTHMGDDYERIPFGATRWTSEFERLN